MYSKKAIPQLANITNINEALRNFKWPYHAKVMKTLDIVNKRIVSKGCSVCNEDMLF